MSDLRFVFTAGTAHKYTFQCSGVQIKTIHIILISANHTSQLTAVSVRQFDQKEHHYFRVLELCISAEMKLSDTLIEGLLIYAYQLL